MKYIAGYLVFCLLLFVLFSDRKKKDIEEWVRDGLWFFCGPFLLVFVVIAEWWEKKK